MQDNDKDLEARRSLITGFGAAAAGLALVSQTACAQSGGSSSFQPARRPADAWFDDLPGTHRVFIDSATALGGAEAVLYANNIYTAQEGPDYNGGPADLAMVICFRHFSTPFGYNDAMWAKYGEVFNSIMNFPDPTTGQAFAVNPLNQTATQLPNIGFTIDLVGGKGANFAICRAATNFFSNVIAGATDGSQPDIFDELVANAIPNSRFVSAGVMALTRAQEYGYSLLYAG
ncbi:MAG: hypothetical protein HKN84_03090 [Gammaproteobacteria bacterium]|nr:hypothetical protein [Gammaproteobacteria bacterium]